MANDLRRPAGWDEGTRRIISEVENRKIDVLLAQMQQAQYAATIKLPPKKTPVQLAPDHELILEMLSRGYAVSQLPVDEHAKEVGDDG